MKKTLLIFIFFTARMAVSQTLFTESNAFLFNRTFLSPAFFGHPDYEGEFTLLNSSQYQKMPGAPVSNILSYDTKILDNTGVGIHLMSEQISFVRNFKIRGGYAFHIKNGLSFGLSTEINHQRIDYSQLNILDPSDPNIVDMNPMGTFLNFNAGINWEMDKFNFGLVCNQFADIPIHDPNKVAVDASYKNLRDPKLYVEIKPIKFDSLNWLMIAGFCNYQRHWYKNFLNDRLLLYFEPIITFNDSSCMKSRKMSLQLGWSSDFWNMTWDGTFHYLHIGLSYQLMQFTRFIIITKPPLFDFVRKGFGWSTEMGLSINVSELANKNSKTRNEKNLSLIKKHDHELLILKDSIKSMSIKLGTDTLPTNQSIKPDVDNTESHPTIK